MCCPSFHLSSHQKALRRAFCHIAASTSKLTGGSPTYLAASHILELDFVERKMVRTAQLLPRAKGCGVLFLLFSKSKYNLIKKGVVCTVYRFRVWKSVEIQSALPSCCKFILQNSAPFLEHKERYLQT